MSHTNHITTWLTAEEAGAALKLNIDTIRRYSAQGLIPCVRLGKFWRYNLEALNNWTAPVKEVRDDRS